MSSEKIDLYSEKIKGEISDKLTRLSNAVGDYPADFIVTPYGHGTTNGSIHDGNKSSPIVSTDSDQSGIWLASQAIKISARFEIKSVEYMDTSEHHPKRSKVSHA